MDEKALFGSFFEGNKTKEVDPIKAVERNRIATKQFPLFSTSILLGYIQGYASPLFMEAEPALFDEVIGAQKTDITKEFLSPLFLLLHNNKNIKFRALNQHLIPDDKQEEFKALVNKFKKETMLSSFLETYKEFLTFLASANIAVDIPKIFVTLDELTMRIKAYRAECVAAVKEGDDSNKVIITSSDLDF